MCRQELKQRSDWLCELAIQAETENNASDLIIFDIFNVIWK